MGERECGTLIGMRPPIFVRTLTDEERQTLEKGLRSPDAFVLRRCQILLASARRERAPRIAASLGIDDQTVQGALHAFNATGLPALPTGSSRAKRTRFALGAGQSMRPRAPVPRTPGAVGKPTSVWTLALAAEVSCATGSVATQVSGETIRQTLLRLGVSWERAKHWITSPDPAYARKKGGVTA